MRFTGTITLCNIFLIQEVLGITFLTVSRIDWEKVEYKLPISGPVRTRRTTKDLVKKLNITSIKENVEELPHRLSIFPGTKWCGPGDVARNYSDLGVHAKEDMCCREHDHCLRFFAKGECKQGLCNTSPFTRSHCHCDMKFRECLQDVDSTTANAIGTLFFDVNRMKCYREMPPCSPWEGSTSTASNENSQECELEFVDAGRYHPEKKLTIKSVFNAKKCFFRKILPGVSNCR